MAYFPFFIDISNKRCCIFGGGIVALRKIEAMLEFDADITVIAPMVCEEIEQHKDRVRIRKRPYQEEDLKGTFFAIAATDNPAVNQSIAAACREQNILVNVVDVLEECSFLFPAYVKKKNITIGVTTAGKSPVMAGRIKKSIQDILPDYYEKLIDSLGEYREMVKQKVPSGAIRARIFKELADIGLQKEGNLIPEDVTTVIEKFSDKLGGSGSQNGQDS